MASKAISQREARALRRRVRELEARERALRQAFGRDYPGTALGWMRPDDETRVRLETARRLGFVIVTRVNDDGVLMFWAVPTEVRRGP